MRKVLLFSGGYDSTCLLANIVSHADVSDDVVAVTIQHNLTGVTKLRREYENQLLTLRELRKRFPKVHITHEIIKVESFWQSGPTVNTRGLSQPLFWLTNLIPLLSDGDCVYLAYIQSDQVMLHESAVVDMWNAILKIQEHKNIELSFPFKYYEKHHIVQELIDNYDYLLPSCTSCESTLYDGQDLCGECTPCTHIKTALMTLSLSNDEHTRNKARELLEEKFSLQVTVTNMKIAKDEQCEEDSFESVACC